MENYIMPFSQIRITDVPVVGGKNASLGEMYSRLSAEGILVPDGFATTAAAYWHFTGYNKLGGVLRDLMQELDKDQYSNLASVGNRARALLKGATIPQDLAEGLVSAYRELGKGTAIRVAVRSSATAEDLPEASFAGQHESFLNISGEEDLLEAVKNCYVSLYTDRAIRYREFNRFPHESVALSIGIQKMVRSDKACSGVGFTLEPESGFRNVVHLAGVWGLGENIVQGQSTPDEFLVFKPALELHKQAIIQRKLGKKEKMMIYAPEGAGIAGQSHTLNPDTPQALREVFVLQDAEIIRLANWALIIEKHYGRPMDIEWAKDGETGEIFIVQARPETVQSLKNPYILKEYTVKEKGACLARGEAVGSGIVNGRARILQSPAEAGRLQEGDIIVTDITSPDWDPVLKKATAIVTNKGGRTSHASIVARELGVPAIVGSGNATENIQDGDMITVSCCEGNTGFIYAGKAGWEVRETDMSQIRKPAHTRPMLIVADPDRAFEWSFYPCEGIGLLRMEFIVTHAVGIHPMALVNFDKLEEGPVRDKIERLTGRYPDKKRYFTDQLAQGIATIAAAFYPRDVIVRMSDFKTNEYANLLGGEDFEPKEENPMLGFRGASRYYRDQYKQGFRLECAAIREVRDIMGLTNVKVMIPFCRTVDEGRKVVEMMAAYGLPRHENGLEIYVMAEIPSNVLLADEFARIFDGFSIGSNDLTQLTLGIDRDSSIIADLFDERNKAPQKMIGMMIREARAAGVPVGLCGQAPSDYPEFARFLVNAGISSISFNPDALLKGIENINKAEAEIVAADTAVQAGSLSRKTQITIF